MGCDARVFHAFFWRKSNIAPIKLAQYDPYLAQ
jgi:hypothetical protein